MNIPNLLTIFRIVATPWCGYALFKNGGSDYTWQIIAWWSFFIVGMTDIIDGRLARRTNQVTAFGAFLDPVADKLSIGTALVGITILGRLPWWVTSIIIIREVGVTILRLSVIRRRGVIPASKGGKLKTFFQGFGTGFYILPLNPSLHTARDIFMAIAVVLTVGTGIDYVKKAFSK